MATTLPAANVMYPKKTPVSDGNQGEHNRKRKDIKSNGTPAQMRPIESPSSTAALKVYPPKK